MHSAVARNQQQGPDEALPLRRYSPLLSYPKSLPTVLHIDTERGWRGGERQVLWLTESLVRTGNECVIAARPGQPLALRAAELGLRVLPCSPRWEFDPVAASKLKRFIRRERIQIVHAHTAHAASIALLCARDAQTVITRRVDFQVGRDWISQLKYRRAAAIIAISEAVARALAASGVDSNQIEIIPSGVDLTRSVQRADNRTLRLLGIPDNAPLVVMVAALVQHKDPVTFIRAMKHVVDDVPNAHAIIVGDGPLRAIVEHAIAELALENRVHLAGFRSDAETILAAADVVALSSREEGLGTVLIDALWMGKPIAATRAGGIPEIVQDGSCGLLAPAEDALALGAAISRLLVDDALRSRFSAAGRVRAPMFSVERTASRTALVYDRVIAAARQRSEAASQPRHFPGIAPVRPVPRSLSHLMSFFS
ncbi:MAG TPA: glycosyltransferase [Gemmatimonadaceae bacterium]|nr:glycosyltransferase [Gemmatimonadaceae bacterium]